MPRTFARRPLSRTALDPAPRRRPASWGGVSGALSAAFVLGLAGCHRAGGAERVAIEPAPRVPSLLLVVVDGLRADHLGCYGYPLPTTPTLDRLAARGWRFADTMSTAPWSAPALASLLAGRYPTRLEWTSLDEPLPPDESTLAVRMCRARWRTGAVVSHEFVAAARGFDQGFERFVEVGLTPVDADPAAIVPARRSAEEVSAAALELVDGFGIDPWFLLVHYSDPLPGWPAIADFDLTDPSYAGPVRDASNWRDVLHATASYGAEDRAQLVALYDGEVAATDRAIGALLEGLAARDRLDDTFVVATATSGMELFDHGGLGDQRTLYDELVHVPLLAAGPGIDPRRLDTTSSLVDVAPTLTHWLGLEPWPDYDGVVLNPERVWVERVLFTENDRARRLRAVTSGTWKLIVDLERDRSQLFELQSDPGEQRDLADRQGSRVRELLRALEVLTPVRASVRPASAPRREAGGGR